MKLPRPVTVFLSVALGAISLFAALEAAAGPPPLSASSPLRIGIRGGDTASRKAAVISQWREHLAWALDLPEAGWDVVVFSKDAASAARFAAEVRAQRLSSFISIELLAENWGDEVVPFLTYLESRYESFPPLVVFLHGAPFVHALYLMDTLACVNPRFDGFYSVNGLHMSNRGVLAGPGREDDLWGLFRARANVEWAAANVSFSLPLLESTDFYASAQFVVSRGAVQRRPKAFWEALLRVALNTRSGFPSVSKASWEETERKGKMIAYFMEVVWHELFGNPRRQVPLCRGDLRRARRRNGAAAERVLPEPGARGLLRHAHVACDFQVVGRRDIHEARRSRAGMVGSYLPSRCQTTRGGADCETISPWTRPGAAGHFSVSRIARIFSATAVACS